jgi:hypothetical protein
MALVKNWTFLLNQKPVDSSSFTAINRSYQLQFIAFLLAHGWSAVGSSNGVSVSSTNNILTASDLVWAVEGSNHSWILLQSPVGLVAGQDGSYSGDQSRLWMVLNYAIGSNTYASEIWWFTYAPTGGGTVTNCPSGSNGVVTGGALVNYEFGFTALQTNTPMFHFAITDGGHFWTATTVPKTSSMYWVQACLPLINCAKWLGQDYPFNVYLHAQNHAGNGPVSSYYGMGGWTVNGVVSATITASFVWQSSASGLPLGGNLAAPGLNKYGALITQPLRLGDQAVNGFGLLGDIADVELIGSANYYNGAMNPTGDKCSFGNWYFPANTVIIG